MVDLLSKDFPGDKIYLIDPNPQPSFKGFDKPEMMEILLKSLSEKEVKLHSGFRFESHQEMNNHIFGATFLDESNKKLFIGGIGVFIYADKATVNRHTFKAINDANLIFDDGVIIDNVFRTKDPYIYAAGSCTKFNVNLKTGWSHSLCNSKEVGERLAWFILHFFDPTLPINSAILSRPHNDYSAAVQVSAQLPGGLTYFHYDIPKLDGYKPNPKVIIYF